jgi:hypothetical protein
MLTVPKLNYCEINDKKIEYPLIDILLAQLKQYGNIPTSCPIKKGFYGLKGLLVPDIAFPAIVFSSGTYRNIIKVYDESESNPLLYQITVYLQFDSGYVSKRHYGQTHNFFC